MRKVMLLVSLMVIMILGSATVASAFEKRTVSNGDAIVAKNETIDDDLLLASDDVIVDGTVNGDVIALADTVIVNGTINGNLFTLADRIEVRGAVNGAVLAAGTTVQIDGTVQRSLVAAGSRITTSESANIGGSLLAAGDRLEHRGVLARGAALAGSNLLVSGKVGKEILAGGARLEFADTAMVGGTVDFWSDESPIVATGARTGAVTRHIMENRWTTHWDRPWYFRPGWAILKFGGFLAFGLAALSLFPRVRSRFPEVISRNLWQAPLAGFLTLVATPIAAILLMITVIGVPIGVVALVSLPVLIYVSQIFVAWSVGRLLADRVPALENQSWPILFLIGALLTTLLVEIPYFGGIMSVASLFYGLGAVCLMIVSRERTA